MIRAAQSPLHCILLLFLATTILLSSTTILVAAPEESPKTTVGFIYVGTKDDYGYNQSHAIAAEAVKKMRGVNVIEAERVPETKACQQMMETMITDADATVIFATSYGYLTPHVKEVAAKFPKVTFIHCGGMVREGDPPTIGSYFAYIDEAEYLCGMAAGFATKTNKLGYVAAKPIVPLLRDINAFELGARSVNPNCTLTVIFTGDWFVPDREADAVNLLADKGIDVVSCHVDSPKVVIETAEKRGLYSCGYHADCSALAPKGYLTGAEFNWGPLCEKIVADVKAGRPVPRNYMGGFRDGSVKLSPFGLPLSADCCTRIDAVKGQMIAGTFRMFKGPLKDNKGEIVIKDGVSFGDQDNELWGMNYLVEGVIGNTN